MPAAAPAAVDVTVTPPYATITLNNPARGNSLSKPLQLQLLDSLRNLERDPLVHWVVLTARGKYFCTGMDLSATNDESGSRDVAETYAFGRYFFESVERFKKPIVGLANGPCFGGGIGLFFLADVRLCASTSTFTLSEVRRGLVPALISPTIVREWGVPLAREAMLTARDVSARQLESVGAVTCFDEARDPGGREALRVAMGWLGRNGPKAMQRAKFLVRTQATTSLTRMPGSPFAPQNVGASTTDDDDEDPVDVSDTSASVAQGEAGHNALHGGFLHMMSPSPEAVLGLSTFAMTKGKEDPDWLAFYREKQEEMAEEQGEKRGSKL